jgi:CubicO group peptidase (beta-lactamase class C family)
MKHNKIPGIGIAIIDGDNVWTQNFGYADQKQKKPFSSDTAVSVSEISNLFTNIAIMQLAEQGKIDIDKPLQTYIPDFSIKSRFPDALPISIRSILADHSGLPYCYFKNLFGFHSPYFTSIIDDVKSEYVAFPPNYIQSHSAIGTSLLGIIIERVSGEKYCDYIRENILNPLKTAHSSFSSEIDFEEDHAPFYFDGKPLYGNPLQRDLPEYGLYSSVNDLSHFIKMILAKGKYKETVLLESQTLENMFSNQNENIPLANNVQFGLGWVLNSDPWLCNAGKTIIKGSGDVFGNSLILILPDYQLGVVVVANTQRGDLLNLTNEITKLALEIKAGIKTPELKESIAPPIMKLSPENLRDYEGTYVTNLGLLNINLSGKKLVAQSDNGSFQLVPRTDNTFTMGSRLLGQFPAFSNFLGEYRFTVDKIADRQLLSVHGYGISIIFGDRVDAIPISEDWKARCGKYLLSNEENLPKIVSEVKINRGFLTIKIKTQNEFSFIIKPINENEAIIQGLGYCGQETIQWTKDEDENDIFFFGGWEYKKLE